MSDARPSLQTEVPGAPREQTRVYFADGRPFDHRPTETIDVGALLAERDTLAAQLEHARRIVAELETSLGVHRSATRVLLMTRTGPPLTLDEIVRRVDAKLAAELQRERDEHAVTRAELQHLREHRRARDREPFDDEDTIDTVIVDMPDSWSGR